VLAHPRLAPGILIFGPEEVMEGLR